MARLVGPILWDFGTLTMLFWCRDQCISWPGVTGPPSPALQICTGDNLLEALLPQFSPVFDKPHGQPPLCSHDHNITLVQGTQPVTVRPYCYPATHKDELEC